MGFFRRLAEEHEQRQTARRQNLMMLSEKELLVEMVILLEDISRKSDEIQRKQVWYGN